jgi:hypothetical protein
MVNLRELNDGNQMSYTASLCQTKFVTYFWVLPVTNGSTGLNSGSKIGFRVDGTNGKVTIAKSEKQKTPKFNEITRGCCDQVVR